MDVAEILTHVRTLSREEKKQLVKQLIDLLDEQETPKKHSLVELAGLGAEIWRDVDVDDYINQLRNEWD